MKTITIEELKSLVENGTWTHKQETEYIDSHILEGIRGEDREYNFGSGTLTSTLGDITVTFFESYSYYSDEPDTFDASTEGLEEIWKIEGVKIIDEEGEPADISDFRSFFEENFPDIDYSSITNSI